jgi:hypothetical protein
MSHQRNVEGLLNNARKKSQSANQQANQAIHILLKQGKQVNFKTVSELARVSIPYLYKNKLIRQQIEHLRNQPQPKVISKQLNVSENSKDSIIKLLKDRIKELQKENQALKTQIEIAYGRIVLLESAYLPK